MNKEEIKEAIENNLYYLIECGHCETVFLIEESIDDGKKANFTIPCPRCTTDNIIKKGQNRLLLQLKKVMDPDEINPYIVKLAKKIRIEGFDI